MANCYRVPVQEYFQWQQPVIRMDLTAPPGSPAKGDRYVVASGATGAWSGYAKYIAYCSDATGPVWSFTAPTEGMIVWDANRDDYFHYNGSAWVRHGQKDLEEAKRYALLVGAP